MKHPPKAPLTKGKGWLRLTAAADLLGVSVSTLRRWADAGAVPSYRSPGGQRRFRRADIERQLTSRAAAKAAAGGNGGRSPRQTAAFLRDQSTRLASLLDASRAIATAARFEDALGIVAQRTAEGLGSPECIIYEYDREQDAIIPRALYEVKATGWDRIGEPFPLADCPVERRMLVTGEVVQEKLSDPDLDPGTLATFEAWGDKSALSVPCRFGDESKGVLTIFENAGERRFDDDEIAFASGLGELAAATIHNAQLLRRLEERNRRLASLVDAGRAISSTVVLEDVLNEVARQAGIALGSPACVIWEYVGESCDLVERAYYAVDPDDDYVPRFRNPLDEDPVDSAILAGGVVVQESVSDPDLHPDSRDSMERWGEKTCLSVPLIFNDEPVGLLIVLETERERDFTADERDLAAALGKQASAAIHNAKLFRRQEEQTRRLASLLDVSRAITSTVVGEDLLATLARKATEALDCAECVIWEYDAAADTLTAQALYQRAPTGDYDMLGVPQPLSEWPDDRALLEDRDIIVSRRSDPAVPAQVRASMEQWGERTVMAIPLYFGHAPLGILSLIETEKERVFTDAEKEMARGLGEHAAVAMHNARLFERLQLRTYETELLNDIARRASTSLNLSEVAAATVDVLRRLTRFDSAVLLTVAPSGDLEVEFTTDPRNPLAGTLLDEVDPRFLERIEREKVVLLDLPSEAPLPPDHPVFAGLRSAAVIALFEEGRVVGALALGSESGTIYGTSDRRVFEGVGAHLSLAVKNARLYESIKQLHVGGLRALSSALNAKDYYTLGHTARVATYAALVAAELGWSPEFVDRVEEVAYLHDIGKISVSDRILLKPSRLSEEDWQLMREHPGVSAEILAPLLEERLVAGVRHHHERYDGKGYPDGLAGGDIPEIARLLCVVDSYDAMSSRRLYRPPFSYAECLEELKRCRGTQFDPAMVDAFVVVLERLHAVKAEATAAAEEAARQIDAAKHMVLRQPGDEKRPEYAEIAQILRAAQAAHPSVPELSTEIRLDEQRVMLIVDAQADPKERVPLGDTLLADEEQTQAFNGRPVDSNVVYVDSWGAWVTGRAPIRNSEGRVVALVSADVPATTVRGMTSDVARSFSDLVQSAATRLTRLEIDAMTDFLSGLYNHRYFQDRLAEEVDGALDKGGELSLLFCDIDHFKDYNDRLGHTAGDAALREVGQIIDSSIRAVDVAARYGGDEFAVILVGTGANVAYTVAERIRATVETTRLQGEGDTVTVSIGIATLPQDGETKEQLVERADWAMYLAKHRGRDLVVSFRAGSGDDDAAASEPRPAAAATQLIGAMAGLADSRQSYAEKHSETVARLAAAMANELGLDAADVKAVEEAARLRDIGQFAVLEEVLSKPDRLTESEWEMVRQHPVVGERLLRALKVRDEVAEAVAYHHERYDGAGYPEGLRAEEIPLSARIISAACAYEAMVVPRPYREARSKAEALAEIRHCAGSQFDPEVAACLERILC